MYVVTSCWFSGFTSLPRTWFCTHCWGKQSCELQDLNMSCCSLLYWTYHVSWEKNQREDDPTLRIFARGTLHIFARGIKICKYFSECRARAQERASAVVWVLSPAFRGLSLVLHEIPVANFYGRFLPPLWIMLLLFKGPLLPLKGSLSHAAWIFAAVWDEKDTNHPLALLTAGPRVLSFVSSVSSCKVAKLPSCIRIFCFHPRTE